MTRPIVHRGSHAAFAAALLLGAAACGDDDAGVDIGEHEGDLEGPGGDEAGSD